MRYEYGGKWRDEWNPNWFFGKDSKHKQCGKSVGHDAENEKKGSKAQEEVEL